MRDVTADRAAALKAARALIREYDERIPDGHFPTGSQIAEVIVRACPGLSVGQITVLGRSAADAIKEGYRYYVTDSTIRAGLRVLEKNRRVLGIKVGSVPTRRYVWVD